VKRWLILIIALMGLAAVFPIGAAKASAGPDCTEPIPDIFQRVSPSVVYISAVAIDPFGVPSRVNSLVGSGFIISDDGLVLTNSHVVYGHQAIAVTLDDGVKVRAKLLGADPILDLAVLRIPVRRGRYPKATLGDSDAVRIGEDVLAIGNPAGLEQTLTRGVVSGVNRFQPESPLSLTRPLIQTDAPINPGNSGGPLLNRCGEVIGINTSLLTDVQNIGFAVPINIAKRVIPDLVEKGRLIRPWLGVTGKLVTKDLMGIINVSVVDGLLVETVEPGSPAQKAGIREGEMLITIDGEDFLLGGDIITAINGQALDDSDKMAKLIRSLKVGDKVQLTLYRDQKTRTVEFVLPERPVLPGDLPTGGSSGLLPMRKGGTGFPLK
jgi:serine protease Do